MGPERRGSGYGGNAVRGPKKGWEKIKLTTAAVEFGRCSRGAIAMGNITYSFLESSRIIQTGLSRKISGGTRKKEAGKDKRDNPPKPAQVGPEI